MSNQVPELYAEFERLVENEARYGKAIAEQMVKSIDTNVKLNALELTEALSGKYNNHLSDKVAHFYRKNERHLKKLGDDPHDNAFFKDMLVSVVRSQEPNLQPGVPLNPANKKEAGSSLRSDNQKIAEHPFLLKMDKAIRDAVEDYNKHRDPAKLSKALTTAYDKAVNTAENDLRNELKMRLAMTMKPSFNPKPKPPGM